jgi:small subunit ribosomal protein S17
MTSGGGLELDDSDPEVSTPAVEPPEPPAAAFNPHEPYELTELESANELEPTSHPAVAGSAPARASSPAASASFEATRQRHFRHPANAAGHFRIEADGFPFPIQVRGVQEEASTWVVGSSVLSLQPGEYIVSTRSPGSDPSLELYKVKVGDDCVATFPALGTSKRPRFQAALPFSLPALQSVAPDITGVKFWDLHGLADAQPIDEGFLGVTFEARSDRVELHFGSVVRSSILAQVAVKSGRPLYVTIPATALPHHPSATLELANSEHGLKATARLRNESVDYALRFLTCGNLEEADQLVRHERRSGLFRNLDDPIGVSAASYVLLALGANELVGDWAKSFADRFPDWPDAAIILGETLRRRSRALRFAALAQFLKTEQLGLPVFTEGLSILYSRLSEFDDLPEMTETARAQERRVADRERAVALRDRLRKIANRVDYSAPTLTFRSDGDDVSPLSALVSPSQQLAEQTGQISGEVPAGQQRAPRTTRRRRCVLQGVVTSDKMDKTRRVEAKRLVQHPRYGKILERRTVCYVHDEENISRQGDVVLIMETRPLSKTKRWRLVSVIGESSKQLGKRKDTSTNASEP